MKREARDRLLLPVVIPVGILVAIVAVVIAFSRILLSLQAFAATGVALVVAAGILVVATWVSGRARVGTASLAALVTGVLGIAMVAGGIAIAAIGPPEEEVPGGAPGPEGAFAITLAAEPNAAVDGFAQSELRVPAGTPVAMTFENGDPQVQHNVSVWEAEDFSGQALFTGDIITGTATIEYRIPPLAEGTYYFRCDVHPTTMTGTIVVEAEGGAPPAATESPAPGATEASPEGADGGEATTIVAEAIAFDIAEIPLPAGTETSITMDNRDAGTQHNVAIYRDEAFTASVFQGELFAGPGTVDYRIPALDPGTYYFRCDVHPNMQGTVRVE